MLAFMIQEGTEPYKKIDVGGGVKEGFQVAVAVLGRVDASVASTPEARTQKFAKALHDGWGVGDPVYQTGVMAVVAIEDRYLCVLLLVLPLPSTVGGLLFTCL